jgi:hypothetical protein
VLQLGFHGLKLGAALMDFEAVHRDRARRFDAEPDAVALNGYHFYADAVADYNLLAELAGKN